MIVSFFFQVKTIQQCLIYLICVILKFLFDNEIVKYFEESLNEISAFFFLEYNIHRQKQIFQAKQDKRNCGNRDGYLKNHRVLAFQRGSHQKTVKAYERWGPAGALL